MIARFTVYGRNKDEIQEKADKRLTEFMDDGDEYAVEPDEIDAEAITVWSGEVVHWEASVRAEVPS